MIIRQPTSKAQHVRLWKRCIAIFLFAGASILITVAADLEFKPIQAILIILLYGPLIVGGLDFIVYVGKGLWNLLE